MKEGRDVGLIHRRTAKVQVRDEPTRLKSSDLIKGPACQIVKEAHPAVSFVFRALFLKKNCSARGELTRGKTLYSYKNPF